MKKLTLLSLLVTVLLSFGAPSAFAGASKVNVCHIPPGDPDNFHTITISENALAAHLAHGDIAGPCDAACATLCDDGNACTIDDAGDCEQNGCPTTRQAVDCNDGNTCTTDACEPISGCINTVDEGALCDDGETCTGVDTCQADGSCGGPAIPNCCLDNNDCSQDLCDNASCDTASNQCVDAPVVCDPPDACHVSVCDASSGQCATTPVACGEGESCNPATGACEQQVSCPAVCTDIFDGAIQLYEQLVGAPPVGFACSESTSTSGESVRASRHQPDPNGTIIDMNLFSNTVPNSSACSGWVAVGPTVVHIEHIPTSAIPTDAIVACQRYLLELCPN